MALEVIDKSPSVSVLYSTAALHRGARAWLGRFDDQVISYTDAISFALMKARRCKQAISFDQHLRPQRGGEASDVVTYSRQARG